MRVEMSTPILGTHYCCNAKQKYGYYWYILLIMNNTDIVGFEVLTAVVMKSTIFLDIMLCGPLKVTQRFRGTYPPHLLATCFHAGFLLGLFFDPEDGGDMFL
jgi:hypothetical protein